MTVDREQIRRDAPLFGGQFGADVLALLDELEEAERGKEVLRETNRALQRSAIANRDGRKLAEKQRDEWRAFAESNLEAIKRLEAHPDQHSP